MFVFVDILEVDAKQRIGEVPGDCRVGKVDMDNQDRQQTEQDIETQCAEASECIHRPDDAIFILYASKKRAPGTKSKNVLTWSK